MVVLDDCGFAQLGCSASEIETTTIDGLAQDGVRMNAFPVTALCSPSIAAARPRRSPFSTSAPISAPPRAGVVLAAGGFSCHSEFRRRHQPMGGDWTGAADGDTGDAIQAGMAVGAATASMDDAWWAAAFQYPGGGVTSCLWERSMPYVDLGHSQLARIRRSRTGHRSRSRTIGGSRGVRRRRSQRTTTRSAGVETPASWQRSSPGAPLAHPLAAESDEQQSRLSQPEQRPPRWLGREAGPLL